MRLTHGFAARGMWLGLIWLAAGLAQAQTHPSLLFDAADLPELISRKDREFYAYPWNELLYECRINFGPGSPIPPTGNLRRNAQTILCHGALLLIDPALAAQSEYQSNTLFFQYYSAALNLSGWSNLFGNDPISSGYILSALAVGFDWHYDKFSEVQRNDIIAKLTARADYMMNNLVSLNMDVPTELNHPTNGYLHTFKVLRNRTLIGYAGFGMVAYVLEGHANEAKRQGWINQLNAMINAWGSKQSTDGMMQEGYAYHEFLAHVWFLMMEARSHKTGVNQFTLYPFMSQHPLVSLYSWVPGGDRSFGFNLPMADTGADPPADMVANVALVAKKLKGDPNHLDELANWMQDVPVGSPGNNSYQRTGPLHYFYADDSIAVRSPSELNLPTFHFFPHWGVFVWRSDWENTATYFTCLAGPQIGGHQQPEMGNFTISKAGAPYVAHHLHTAVRAVQHHNIMFHQDIGQHGEESTASNGLGTTTKPHPPANWASVSHVLGDNHFFNVITDLENCYRSNLTQNYDREFLGFDDYFFVLDRVQSSSGNANYQHYTHAYRTDPPGTNGALLDIALDINTNLTGNPWSGSNGAWSITPRDLGPITESMTVKDLSPTLWPSSVAPAMVDDILLRNTQRGFKLIRTASGSTANSLMAYHFPQPGRDVLKWTATGDNGFLIMNGGSVEALTVWTGPGGAVNGAGGLTLTGAMGGIHKDKGWFWARECSQLSHDGVTYLTTNAPISVFCNFQQPGIEGANPGLRRDHPLPGEPYARIITKQNTTLSLRHQESVNSVYLNGEFLHPVSWSWADGMLQLSLISFTNGVLISTESAPDLPAVNDLINYLLGQAPFAENFDVNDDTRVDISDLVKLVQMGGS